MSLAYLKNIHPCNTRTHAHTRTRNIFIAATNAHIMFESTGLLESSQGWQLFGFAMIGSYSSGVTGCHTSWIASVRLINFKYTQEVSINVLIWHTYSELSCRWRCCAEIQSGDALRSDA
jgi:hypothetical protein